MKTINHTLALFIIIIIEGYIVLSTELLAIRQTIPYVGSGTDTIAIIIAAVLMPLAFGYQFGGQFKPKNFFKIHISIRKKLIFNILVSSTILLFGMSHEYIRLFFYQMTEIGINHRILQASIYSAVFLVIPVYLLGQTVPLVSNFFSKERLSKITGKILFFSTVGSFTGAIISTIFLMPILGVHHTVSLNFVLMAILVIMISKHKFSLPVKYSIAIAISAIIFNSDAVMKKYKIVDNNQYNTITAGTIKEGEYKGDRIMVINGNFSSMYNDQSRKYNYIEFAEKIAIEPILDASPAKNILVIGSGAFTFGHNDTNNNYTYVDIDKKLKNVAEKYVLKEPIGDNKVFVPKPARAFLNGTKDKYDMIYLDTFLGGASMPEHLMTQEFFLQIKEHLNKGAVLVANIVLSPNLGNKFSRNIDNTLRSVFPYISHYAINDSYNLWSENKNINTNVAYIYKHDENYGARNIYTDNKSTMFYDKPK